MTTPVTSYGDATTPNGGAYTDTAAFSRLIKTAYDQKLSMEFAAATILRGFADKKVVNQTQPGSEVIFSIHKKMALNLEALEEVADTGETALANPTQIGVRVHERGSYTIYTEALTQFAYDDALAANVMNAIKMNQLETLDALVGNVLKGDNIAAGDKATTVYNSIVNDVHYTTLAAAEAVTDNVIEPLTAESLRIAVAELRTAAVPTWDNGYVAVMHPRVASKFRAATDAAGWRDANTYVNTTGIINGEIGTFEGVRVIENPRVPVNVNGVYHTFIFGKEALAEVVAKEPQVIVDGDIVDPYGRKTAIGWYGILGWNLFRPESLFAIKSTLVAPSA